LFVFSVFLFNESLAFGVFASLPAIRPARQSWGPWTGVSPAQFRWALSVVLSRSFVGGFVVPFADFANHGNSGVVMQAVASVSSFEEAVRWREPVRWAITNVFHVFFCVCFLSSVFVAVLSWTRGVFGLRSARSTRHGLDPKLWVV
jgi:hypothetical protein